MKAAFVSLLGLAAGALAQNGSTIAYSTSYWTECSGSTIGTGLRTGTAMPGATETATNVYTQTYCPRCTHTTVWSTAYAIYCPTGVTTETYTITATTSGMATPTWSTGPNDVPPGFTAAVQICTVCGPETITQIMTYPVTAVPYQSGMPGAPTPPPVAPGSGGAAPVCPGPQCQGGYAAPTAAPNNNTGGTLPYKGAAATLSLGGFPILIALGALLL